jgi:hypothetical protein
MRVLWLLVFVVGCAERSIWEEIRYETGGQEITENELKRMNRQ